MFDQSAPVYDAVNGFMSFGTDVRYRRDALRRAGIQPGMRVLDVACGTGWISRIAEEIVGSSGAVYGLDPSVGMLEVARSKRRVVRPIAGTAEALPFNGDEFDFVCMSFAVRHVSDLSSAFHEYKRVLKPGGRLLIIDLTVPDGRLRRAALRIYMKNIVPLAARISSVGRDSAQLYAYFWDTVENCVPPETVQSVLSDTGFDAINRNVALGMFSEYSAIKPLALKP